MRLKNKVAIISGVGRRFGQASALLFAKEGAKVVLSSRGEELINSTCSLINERNGTANIFMVYEPLTGQRITKVTKRRTKKDWAYLMRDIIDNDYKDAKKIVLVMDNLNTHNKSSLL